VLISLYIQAQSPRSQLGRCNSKQIFPNTTISFKMGRPWHAPAFSSRFILVAKLVLRSGTLEYSPCSAMTPAQYVGAAASTTLVYGMQWLAWLPKTSVGLRNAQADFAAAVCFLAAQTRTRHLISSCLIYYSALLRSIGIISLSLCASHTRLPLASAAPSMSASGSCPCGGSAALYLPFGWDQDLDSHAYATRTLYLFLHSDRL
jgi:hypothetical protein